MRRTGIRLRVGPAVRYSSIVHLPRAAVGLALLASTVSVLNAQEAAGVSGRGAQYKQALDRIRAGEFEDARRRLASVIAEHPGFAPALRSAAYVEYRLGNPGEAAAILGRYFDLVPQPDAHAYVLRGRIQISREQYREAAESFQQVLRLDPGVDGVHFSLGKLYHRLGEDGDAIKHLEKAVRTDSERFGKEARRLLLASLWRQAEAAVQSDDVTHALANLDRVIALDGTFSRAYLQSGVLRARRESDLHKAESHIAEFLRQHPGNARAHMLLGEIRHRLKRFDAAADSYRKASSLDPAIPGLYALIGALYYELAKYDEALDYFQKAVSANPGDVATVNNIGLTYIRMKRSDQAEKWLNKALAMDPGKPFVHYSLAQLFVEMGRTDDALAKLREWIELVSGEKALRDLEADEVFRRLYENSQFQALMAELRARTRREARAGPGNASTPD